MLNQDVGTSALSYEGGWRAQQQACVRGDEQHVGTAGITSQAQRTYAPPL